MKLSQISNKTLQGLRILVSVLTLIPLYFALKFEDFPGLPKWSVYVFWFLFFLGFIFTYILRRESERRPRVVKEKNQFWAQVAFTLLTSLLFLGTVYGALVTTDSLSRIIRFIGAGIFLLMTILLAWGLVYLKKKDRERQFQLSSSVPSSPVKTYLSGFG